MPGTLARLLHRRSRHACARCGGDFLCPIDWHEADGEHWCIDARCGACGAWHALVLTNAEAAAWDAEVARQTQSIERAVRRLDRDRMTREAAAFAAALERDLIDAGERAPPASRSCGYAAAGTAAPTRAASSASRLA